MNGRKGVVFKLENWKFYLSNNGRSTLCWAFYTNLPTYFMSSFHMLKKVVVDVR